MKMARKSAGGKSTGDVEGNALKDMQYVIGMPFEEVRKNFEFKDILSEKKMSTGYFWLNAWVEMFSETILVAFCFKDRVLWSIDYAPHITRANYRRETWDDLDPDYMMAKTKADYKICEKWLARHKKQLPECARLFYDRQSLDIGIRVD